MFFLFAEYLPSDIKKHLLSYDEKILKNISEIRFRANKRICLCLITGALKFSNKITTKEDLEKLISIIFNHSYYAKKNEIINGYVTLTEGIRVGICGRYICDGDKIVNIADYFSINIRIPHHINGICLGISRYIKNTENKLLPTLIISSPGGGKTTLLKDIIRCITTGEKFKIQNLCVIDERCEITSGNSHLGDTCDIIQNISKPQGINIAIRSMSPDIIATDEIGSKDDIKALQKAKISGITPIATIHGENMDSIRNLKEFDDIKSVFSRYIVLDQSIKKGFISKILNSSGDILFEGKNA